MRDAVEAGELLEQFGLFRGTHAEIGGDSIADCGGILAQHAREAAEALPPYGRRGMSIHRKCTALQIQRLRELCGMGREAGRYLCRGHRG